MGTGFPHQRERHWVLDITVSSYTVGNWTVLQIMSGDLQVSS